MNIEQEIRAQIEKNRDLKLEIGYINNHLSILEGLLRNERDDVQKQVNEAYQRGYDKGYADKTNNDEVCDGLAKDIYQRGLDDAWEAARKVALNPNENGLSLEEVYEIFGCATIQQAFRRYSAQQTIAKLKAYEKEQKKEDEIEVRDEVIAYGCRGVVTYVHKNLYTVMMSDGSCGNWGKGELKKTGKKHDIDKIMEELKG